MNRSSQFARRAASTIALGALTFSAALALGTAASTAPGDDVQLTLSQDSGLTDGQAITVDGTGVDPELGYYLSTCVIGTDGPTGPDCAGGRTDMDASVWVSNNPAANVPISPDGTFTAELNVTQTGETMNKVAIDCDETPCAITLFGDHRNGFVYTAGTPVAFGESAAAPTTSAPATTGTAEDVEVADVAAQESGAEFDDASDSNTVWWIVGGVIVVAAIAGGGVAYSKRS